MWKCSVRTRKDGRSPADGASWVQTAQETIPFTTVTFSFRGFLLMCSLALLCWASSLRRWWMGEIGPCLLQHTSKKARLRKARVLRGPADCIPIMHHCLLDRSSLGNINILRWLWTTPQPRRGVWLFDCVTMVKMAVCIPDVMWNGTIYHTNKEKKNC